MFKKQTKGHRECSGCRDDSIYRVIRDGFFHKVMFEKRETGGSPMIEYPLPVLANIRAQ